MLGVLWIGSRSRCLLDCELEIRNQAVLVANYQLKIAYRSITMLKRIIIEPIHTPETGS
jgi:hypothetical protein